MNTALARIQAREPVAPVADSDVEPLLPTLEQEVAPVIEVAKDDSGVANTGALQGPLQGNEQLGGAMSSPGVRPAAHRKPTTETKAAITRRPDVNPKAGERKYGDVKFADTKNNKYPIDSADHVRSAWSYINKPENAGKYDAGEVKAIKGRIQAAAKKFGVEIAESQNKETYISPRKPSLLQRGRTGVVITKGQDGKRLLMMITTNSYRDREKEAIATKALKSYVDRAWSRVEEKCLPDNTLRFWHNGDIGDIVYADMEGPFLIEVAKERPNKAINLARPGQKPFMVQIKDVWNYIEANPDNVDWGASHGFKFYKGQRTKDGVYQKIYKFESSVLPLRWAANPYTFSGVVDMEPRDKLLNQLVGRANAKALRRGAQQLKKALDVRGVTHKEKKPDTSAFKGLLEDLEEKFGEMVGDLTDDSAKQAELKQQLMEAVVDCLAAEPDAGTGEPAPEPVGLDADHAAGYHYDEADGEDDTEPGVDEEEKEDDEMTEQPVMSGKALKLMDALIESQEHLDKNYSDLATAVKSLAALGDLPRQFAAMEKRQKALEVQLKMRPQSASDSPDTEVDDPDLLDRVKKAMSNFDPFFGVHVAEE